RSGEYGDIGGDHLEQACRCRAGLRPAAELTGVGERASARLESAGRRALARRGLPAAIALLERATELLAEDEPRRALLLSELGAALIDAGGEEHEAEAERALAEARRIASAAHDERADSHALVQQQFLQLLRVEHRSTDEAARAV